MTTILIVDDHDIVRVGLSRLLSDTPRFTIVGETGTGEEAIELVKKLEPDMVLMDINMPGIGGLEATRKIVARHPDIKVIGVTAISDGIFPDRFLRAGAKAYLSKESGVEEIVKAIDVVTTGRQYIGSDIAQKMAIRSFSGNQDSPFESLSERELQTVLMVVKGIKVPDIAKSLCVTQKTVNTYRYRIFEKLEINSDVELVHEALRHNILTIE